MQIDLIPSQRPRRLSRAEARQRRDIGMQRVSDKAERTAPGWCEKAADAMRRFAAAQDGLFTVEMARTVLEQELPPVHDGRAWGVVAVMSIRRGYIVKTKQTAPACSSNGSLKSLFCRGPGA